LPISFALCILSDPQKKVPLGRELILPAHRIFFACFLLRKNRSPEFIPVLDNQFSYPLLEFSLPTFFFEEQVAQTLFRLSLFTLPPARKIFFACFLLRKNRSPEFISALDDQFSYPLLEFSLPTFFFKRK